MNNGLHDVISAAVENAGRLAEGQDAERPVRLLRNVEADHRTAPHEEVEAKTSAEMMLNTATRRRRRATMAATGEIETPDDNISNGGNMGATVTILGNNTMKGGGTMRATWPIADTKAVEEESAGTVIRKIAVKSADTDAMAEIKAPRVPVVPAASENSSLGPGGLRLAFWLCGFHEALMERRRQGEQLTESENLLVKMSSKDFAGLRPFVTNMTIDRLNTVVNAPDLASDACGGSPGAIEVFALTTLRNLSARACQLLQEEGPDAALALFGASDSLQEPLAIFQRVFTTTLDLVEAFERIIPGEARLLARLAEALDSAVENI